jgi:hypothetical protein
MPRNSFRHSHGAMFGKSELFFVCILRADAESSRRPFKLQPSEIAQAKWAEWGDFLAQAPCASPRSPTPPIYLRAGAGDPFTHAAQPITTTMPQPPARLHASESVVPPTLRPPRSVGCRYPRDSPLWAAVYGCCAGADGMVGSGPGLDAQSLEHGLWRGASYCYFASRA